MKKKYALLMALSVTALGFSNDWNLDITTGYVGTLKNSEDTMLMKKDKMKFEPTLPVELKLALHPSDIDVKTNLTIKNDSLDGLFKTNKLDKSEVKADFHYATPDVYKGLKFFTDDNIVVYKTKDAEKDYNEESGDINLKLGLLLDRLAYKDVKLKTSLAGYYNSNKLIYPKEAGLEYTLGNKDVMLTLQGGYDFETKELANKILGREYVMTTAGKDVMIPVHALAKIGGTVSKGMYSFSPELKVETRVLDTDNTYKVVKDIKTVTTTPTSEKSRLEVIRDLKLDDNTKDEEIKGLLFTRTKTTLSLPSTFKFNSSTLKLGFELGVENNIDKDLTKKALIKNEIVPSITLNPEYTLNKNNVNFYVKDKLTAKTTLGILKKEEVLNKFKETFELSNKLETGVSYNAKVHEKVTLTPAFDAKLESKFNNFDAQQKGDNPALVDVKADYTNKLTFTPSLNVSYKPTQNIELWAKPYVDTVMEFNKKVKGNPTNKTTSVSPAVKLGVKFAW